MPPPSKRERGIVKSIKGSVTKIFRKTGSNDGKAGGGGDEDTDRMTPISVRRLLFDKRANKYCIRSVPSPRSPSAADPGRFGNARRARFQRSRARPGTLDGQLDPQRTLASRINSMGGGGSFAVSVVCS